MPRLVLAPTKERIWAAIIYLTTELPHHEGECSICLEGIDNSAAGRRQARPVRTRCGHVFHDTCLAQWNEHKSSCPYCRQELYGERLYGMPFHGREPIWLDEEVFAVWRATEDVGNWWVRERGMWNTPRPDPVPEPVVEENQ